MAYLQTGDIPTLLISTLDGEEGNIVYKSICFASLPDAAPRRGSPRMLKCLIHRLRENRMRYFNRISIVGLIALEAVEIPASTAPENYQPGEFAR